MSASDTSGADRLARAKSRSVMICTPIARDPAWQYTRSIVDTCITLERLGIRHQVQLVVGNSNLPRARNELVAEFLASPYDDLMFIDDDMGWHQDAVVRLLASDKPFIGGVGRKRVDKPNSDPAVWCVRLLAGASLVQDDFGSVQVHSVGTGFLKISRSVFEALAGAHRDWKRRGHDTMRPAVRSSYYKFFRFGDDEHETGEDYEFCRAWHRLGGTVWIDPEIVLSHVGARAYTGSISELMQEVQNSSEAA